jgi:hypothetical protein
MIVASATSAGGLTALAMKTLRGRTDDPATPARPEGGRDDGPSDRLA